MIAVYELILAAVACLLLAAAVEDVRTRRLPNRLTAAVAVLYPFHVLANPTAIAWPIALALAAALFACGAVLFAWRLLGGGDVKLIAALGLWSGPEHLAAFAAITALSGGALGLAYLWYERQGWFLIGPLLTALRPRRAAAEAASALLPPPAAGSPRGAAARKEPVSIPYGVAIAVGGLAVLYRTLGL
ncbi:MAG: prepilin peptidase [Acetobacteraceae bacterium]|nr:prepilin peptidase [Acetobacteraceae bacterium]